MGEAVVVKREDAVDDARLVAYVVGELGPAGVEDLRGHLARRLNAQALVVDYGLAPENQHPGPVQDCLRAYSWLLDSGVDSDIPVTTAATDNIAAAGTAADKMADLIGNQGEVALVVHDQTSRTGIDRRDGFLKAMKEKHADIQIVDVQYGGGDQLKSTDITKAIIDNLNQSYQASMAAPTGRAPGQ